MKKEINLNSTLDASVWAKEFMRINPPIDEDTMRAWFANSIMCGSDYTGYKLEKRIRFCAGLISTMDQFKDKHPEEVYEWICNEADKDL